MAYHEDKKYETENPKSIKEDRERWALQKFNAIFPPPIKHIIYALSLFLFALVLVLNNYRSFDNVYNFFALKIFNSPNNISFWVEIRDSEDVVFDKQYILSVKNNENTDISYKDFQSIGVQYLLCISYNNIIVDVIIIPGIYSKNGYMFDDSASGFVLNMKSSSGCEELKANLYDELKVRLEKEKIPINDLAIEELTLICALFNDNKHDEPQAEYYLLSNDGLLSYLDYDTAQNYQYGRQLSDIQDTFEIAIRKSTKRIEKIHRNLLWR